MEFLASLESIFSIIFIIFLGYILRKKDWFHESYSENTSKLITNIALPASIFVSVSKYLTLEVLNSLSNRLIFTFSSVILGYIIAFILVKLMKVKIGRRGVFINAMVNANTIFIGLPLNLALFGEKSLPYYLMYYITNTVSIWTIGAFIIANDTEENEIKGKIDIKKIFSPPLIGFIVALIFLIFKIPIPKFAKDTFTYVGSLVTPLSLMYIGIVLADVGLRSIHFDKETIIVLLGRFIFSPLVMFILLYLSKYLFIDLTDLDRKTFIVQSAAPVFAVLPILVHESDGDVRFATNVVTTSTVLFMIVIPILVSII